MTAPLPVTILGGYLGAGKTTLVNQMLRQADGARLAVLVNEFGTMAIDEDLIEARDDGLICISGGCICCSFGSDLIAALLRLAEMTPRPDHILVEASGVAMPGAIAQSVALLSGFRVEGICVLADCLAVRSQARDEYIGDTITRQIDDADLVILTKTDLAGPEAAGATQVWLDQTWPAKPLVVAPNGRAPNAVLLGPLAGGTHARLPAPHADDRYLSVVFCVDAPCDVAAVTGALGDPGLRILRAKGYLDDISGKRGLVQICGTRGEVTFPDSPGGPGVVCIGLRDHMNTAAIEALARRLSEGCQLPARSTAVP